jgi:hypothetical protein
MSVDFLMGAILAWTTVAFWVVGADYRRWTREREAYRYAMSVKRVKEQQNGEWSNERWSA